MGMQNVAVTNISFNGLIFLSFVHFLFCFVCFYIFVSFRYSNLLSLNIRILSFIRRWIGDYWPQVSFRECFRVHLSFHHVVESANSNDIFAKDC
uniref:Secreted protein n=1 Tax=Brugia timori TaxID=42155 RepID=A0A0R3R3K6_9BILA